jgi:hypothetical protein
MSWSAGRRLPRWKISGVHFCQRLNRTYGYSAARRISSLEETNDIRSRNRDLPFCSTIPQPTMLRRAPILKMSKYAYSNKQANKQTNSFVFSPQAKYTDWATATSRRNLLPTFVDRGVSRGQPGGSPTAVNLRFLDGSSCFPFQVAPNLSSQGLSGPRCRPTAMQKIWEPRESNTWCRGLQPGTLTTRPQRRSNKCICN